MKKILYPIVLSLCLFAFTGCNNQLSQEQLDQANEAFATIITTEGNCRTSEISCFFTCYYSDPREIDLGEFLKYCPAQTTLTAGDEAEFQDFLGLTQWAEEKEVYKNPDAFFVPVRRYVRAEVSAILVRYAGITVDDLYSLGEVSYLQEYDAFYNMTSDYAPGHFEAAAGETDGNCIRFWSEANSEEMRDVLTLEKVGERYYIRSFLQEKAP